MKAIKNKIDGLLEYSQLFSGISREKIILGAAVLFLLAILLYQSLVSTQLTRLSSRRVQLKSKQGLISFYKSVEMNMDTLEKNARLKEKELSEIKNRFISKDDLSKYSADLRGLVKSFDLRLLSLDFSSPQKITVSGGKESRYFLKQQLVVAVEGDFRKVMLFLYRLESGSPLLDIDSLSIRRSDNESYNTILDLKGAVYIMTEDGSK